MSRPLHRVFHSLPCALCYDCSITMAYGTPSMTSRLKTALLPFILLIPAAANAQQIKDIDSLTAKFVNLGNTIIGILIGFSVLWIIFNAVRFIVKADSDDRKKYQAAIIWGIIGLFIILSIWGFVHILTTSFSTVNNTPTDQFPKVEYPAGMAPKAAPATQQPTNLIDAPSGFGQQYQYTI